MKKLSSIPYFLSNVLSQPTRKQILFLFFSFCVLSTLCFSHVTNAATTSSLVGDIDGFGGQTAIGSPPDGFSLGCCFDNRNGLDPDFTDIWSFQLPENPTVINYVHSYDPSSLLDPLSFATLSIQSAGMGNSRGPWAVLFNGINVGSIGGPASTIGTTEVVTDAFDIPLILLGATGNNQVSLIFQDTGADGFAINYSQLTVSSVPLPGAIILFGSSLFLLQSRKLLRCT